MSRPPRRAKPWHSLILMLCLAMLAGSAWPVLHELPAARFLAASAIQLPVGLREQLQAGDLIFRIGDSWQSDVVRSMADDSPQSRGDPYSHVGMLIGDASHWQVIHAVPAELPERSDAVVIDDLDFFLAPERASGAAIYRVAATDALRHAAVSNAAQRLGTPFRVVENDHEGQYCTTLVWYAWQRAGLPLTARFDHLEVPFAAGDYLLPHRLRTAPELRLLFEARTPV